VATSSTNLLWDLPSLREGVLRTPWPLRPTSCHGSIRETSRDRRGQLLNTDCQAGMRRPYTPAIVLRAGRRILTQVLDRPIRAEAISADQLRASLRAVGMGDIQIEGIVGMSSGMTHNFVAENKRGVLTTTPTPLAAWLTPTSYPRSDGRPPGTELAVEPACQEAAGMADQPATATGGAAVAVAPEEPTLLWVSDHPPRYRCEDLSAHLALDTVEESDTVGLTVATPGDRAAVYLDAAALGHPPRIRIAGRATNPFDGPIAQ